MSGSSYDGDGRRRDPPYSIWMDGRRVLFQESCSYNVASDFQRRAEMPIQGMCRLRSFYCIGVGSSWMKTSFGSYGVDNFSGTVIGS